MLKDLLNTINLQNALNKAIVSQPDAGIDLNTSEQAADVKTVGAHPLVHEIKAVMHSQSLGDIPAEMPIGRGLVLALSKIDDGIVSGFVKKDDPTAGDHGEVQTLVEKVTAEALVQALIARGYVTAVTPEEEPTPIQRPVNDLKSLATALRGFKGEVHIHLAKSLDALEKSMPHGTVRKWGDQKYVKHSDGWVGVDGEHHGKLFPNLHESATHKEYADQHLDTKHTKGDVVGPDKGTLADHLNALAEGLFRFKKPLNDQKDK
jgi:hypothetical protein